MPVRKTSKRKRKPSLRDSVVPVLRDAVDRFQLRKSHVWAGVFCVLIAGWMLSGVFSGDDESEPRTVLTAEQNGEGAGSGLFKVRVATFSAEPREAALSLRGRTEADARVELQAETAGIVEALPVRKGARVRKGDIVCRIETGARTAMLDKAKAERRQAELDHAASEKLVKRGHTAKLKVAEFKAKLDAAAATLHEAELDLERTRIKAPFDGTVEAQPAKVGDYLTIGETCATLVSRNPLVVVGAVSERHVGKLKVGMTGSADLATGETVSGAIRFIAASADEKTRTFKIELEVANAQGTLRDGVTADISIPLAEARAHRVSPTLLVLNDAGEIGLRVIENGDTVRFMPVKPLADDTQGIWVAGLPETVTVVTVGQDYVRDGQKVVAVPDAAMRSARQ